MLHDAAAEHQVHAFRRKERHTADITVVKLYAINRMGEFHQVYADQSIGMPLQFLKYRGGSTTANIDDCFVVSRGKVLPYGLLKLGVGMRMLAEVPLPLLLDGCNHFEFRPVWGRMLEHWADYGLSVNAIFDLV